MEVRLVQDKNEIALAHRRTVEAIRAIEARIQFFGFTLELVTGQAVDLQPVRVIQAFLAGKNDKPMIAHEARRPAFPNLPLVEVHRSGCCLTLLMADSRATRRLSEP